MTPIRKTYPPALKEEFVRLVTTGTAVRKAAAQLNIVEATAVSWTGQKWYQKRQAELADSSKAQSKEWEMEKLKIIAREQNSAQKLMSTIERIDELLANGKKDFLTKDGDLICDLNFGPRDYLDMVTARLKATENLRMLTGQAKEEKMAIAAAGKTNVVQAVSLSQIFQELTSDQKEMIARANGAQVDPPSSFDVFPD